jgi:hypothetical protein
METRVMGEMPASGTAAGSQRLRWERGRQELRQRWLRTLCREAWRTRSPVLADLAVDVALPPLTSLVVAAAAGWIASVALVWVGGPAFPVFAWSTVVLLFALHVVRGVQLSARGWRAWLDLGAAPLFMAWKAWLLLRNRAGDAAGWVRTARAGEKP